MKRGLFFSIFVGLVGLGSILFFKHKSTDEQVTDDGKSDEYLWYI